LGKRGVLAILKAAKWEGAWAEVHKGGISAFRPNQPPCCHCYKRDCSAPGKRFYMVGTETWCRGVRGSGHSWEEALADAGVEWEMES
jgi:hypothetical protein